MKNKIQKILVYSLTLILLVVGGVAFYTILAQEQITRDIANMEPVRTTGTVKDCHNPIRANCMEVTFFTEDGKKHTFITRGEILLHSDTVPVIYSKTHPEEAYIPPHEEKYKRFKIFFIAASLIVITLCLILIYRKKRRFAKQ
ncbi:hypothetical protein Dip510_000921 [Elusimicrobium posterum]|uniref:hypothetical protein n=1 Tax=Elusimicrobium posterum TaxID=3116653 RepID=UPI003C78A23E